LIHSQLEHDGALTHPSASASDSHVCEVLMGRGFSACWLGIWYGVWKQRHQRGRGLSLKVGRWGFTKYRSRGQERNSHTLLLQLD